jgi:hypothetical protein
MRTEAAPSLDASAECAAVHAEVLGLQFQHPVMRRYHQLTVDAYGAQHTGGSTPRIRVVYALTGLWLALEHGFSGEDVRAVQRRIGEPAAGWPTFAPPPAGQSWTTVVDVAQAGVRIGSNAGHAHAVQRWAEDVWGVWLEHAPGTDDAVEDLLRTTFLEVGHQEGLHGTIGPAAAVHRLCGLLQS